MKRALVIAAIVVAALGAAAVRVVVSGRAALRDGDDHMLRLDPAAAIRSYEAAARWYLPLAPHVDSAYARLRELAAKPGAREPQGEQVPLGGTALRAWRAIRSAARATRTLWTPHAADLADADAAIAILSARDPEAGAGAGDTTNDREAWYLAHLADDERPGIGSAVLAGLGVLVWLAGTIVLVRGIGETGQVTRRFVAGGAAIVLGLACWLVGLYNA